MIVGDASEATRVNSALQCAELDGQDGEQDHTCADDESFLPSGLFAGDDCGRAGLFVMVQGRGFCLFGFFEVEVCDQNTQRREPEEAGH